MKKWIMIIAIALVSCKSEYKQCDFEDSNSETTIYNQILIDIVENHLFNVYLGKSSGKLREELWAETITQKEYDQEIIKLQNQLFGDSTRYRTVYLMDTVKRKSDKFFRLEGALEDDTTINRIAPDRKILLDSMNQLQQNYQIAKFHTCTFKIELLSELKNKKKDMGVISLSKLFLNKNRDEGLVAFGYLDGSWGKECIFQIKKVNNRWKIIGGHIIWIT